MHHAPVALTLSPAPLPPLLRPADPPSLPPLPLPGPQAKQDTAEQQEASKVMKVSIKEAEEEEAALAAARDDALLPMGNIVHDSVPVSDNEVGRWVGRWG